MPMHTSLERPVLVQAVPSPTLSVDGVFLEEKLREWQNYLSEAKAGAAGVLPTSCGPEESKKWNP